MYVESQKYAQRNFRPKLFLVQFICPIGLQQGVSKTKLLKKYGVEGSLMLIIYESLEALHMLMFRNKRDPSLMIEVSNMSLLAMIQIQKATSCTNQSMVRLW